MQTFVDSYSVRISLTPVSFGEKKVRSACLDVHNHFHLLKNVLYPR